MDAEVMTRRSEEAKGFDAIFDQFFKDRTREWLIQLLQEHLGENGRRNILDFKKEMPDGSKLAKTILGIANSGGGVIILGVEQTKNDNTFTLTGLSKFTDKADIIKKTEKYIPYKLVGLIEVRDYRLKPSDSLELANKKFQTIFIDYDPISIPHISQAGTQHIRKAAIYVRRLSETVEANNEELQAILARHISAMNPSVMAPEQIRRAVYNEVLTTLPALTQRVLACYDGTNQGNEDYLRSALKYKHIDPILFPVNDYLMANPIQFYQLEELSEINTIYGRLKGMNNEFEIFRRTSFNNAPEARKECDRIIRQYKNSLRAIDRAFTKHKKILQRLDKGHFLEDWKMHKALAEEALGPIDYPL
ncbi:MAG: AlbA family DNA-binding domain-containing protein [Halobacteriota archaeon]